MKIELVYFDDCPNSPKAAKELEAALEDLGINTKVLMLDREKEGVAKHAQLYGSPSILVNEKDLFGAKPNKYSSCRLYGKLGYPKKEEIIEKIKNTIANNLVETTEASSASH